MRKILLILALAFTSTFSFAQFNGISYQRVLRSYLLQKPEVFGVFDGPESYFVLHFDSLIQSPFDSLAFLCGGKIWHKNKLTHFKGYISADTVSAMDMADTALGEDLFWGYEQPEMKIAGTQLLKFSGEMDIIELDSSDYSGVFSANFTCNFYYRSKTDFVKPLPDKGRNDFEPGMYVSGFWRSQNQIELGNIPFSFASTLPVLRDDGSAVLQDLRFQADGSVSFSNIAIYPSECTKPEVGWFE